MKTPPETGSSDGVRSRAYISPFCLASRTDMGRPLGNLMCEGMPASGSTMYAQASLHIAIMVRMNVSMLMFFFTLHNL